MIYGPSGSGKSFFTADIAQHIATGQPWRGLRVERRLVVYIASEAGTSILKRFVAWRENKMGESAERVPLAIITRGPNLLNDAELAALINELRSIQEQSALPLGMVIFDTLSRSIPGGDENKAEDMTMVVKAADAIRDALGACTVYVHHAGKDVSKGARGHSSLFAAADLVVCVEEKCGTVEKVRDGVASQKFPFQLSPVSVGVDADGDDVLTCLIEWTDIAPVTERPKHPTGKNQKIVMREITALCLDALPSPGTSMIPKGCKTIEFEKLAERAVPRFTGMPAFKARGRISEALTSLQASGFIGAHGELIWPL